MRKHTSMRSSRSTVGFEIDVEPSPARTAVAEEEPFRIALLGDFSQRDRTERDLEGVQGWEIDRDNFDEILMRVAPRLRLASGEEISFASMADFHPDRLFERLPMFQRVHQREFEQGLAAGQGSLLERMLEESTKPVPAENGHGTQTNAVELMRSILHSASFQSLEAAWRGVFFLIRRLETGVDLKLHLFDLSKEELAADLGGAADLRDTFLYKTFARGGGVGEWAVLAGNYTFGNSREDMDLLARLGMIARQAGAPFLAAANASVAGCDNTADLTELHRRRTGNGGPQLWQSLRQMPEAPWLGIAIPRFLARLPYGKDTAPTESFAFEEMAATRAHEDYLWVNPAFACACLLGLAFRQFGWGMRPGSVSELSGLPLDVYMEGGEWHAQPCAEALLSDEAAEAILEQGLIPLIPAKESDRILAPGFRSVADPVCALAGPWDRHR